MEHLKNIMEKLDDMKLSEKAMGDGDYLLLMEELKKAYDKHDVGKFVRVLKVSTSINVFWSDVDGSSGLNLDRGTWAHRSWSEGHEDEDNGSHLNSIEVELHKINNHHTLKIIENINEDVRGCINWEDNTITKCCYEKMKTNGFISTQYTTVIYMNDVE